MPKHPENKPALEVAVGNPDVAIGKTIFRADNNTGTEEAIEKEISIDPRIRKLEGYYEAIDEKKLDIVFSLFSSEIIYIRGKREPIKGIKQLRRFYEEPGGRIIEEGKHLKLKFNLSPSGIYVVNGHFSGRLKNGEAVGVDFIDNFTFNEEDKVTLRITTFPEDQREI